MASKISKSEFKAFSSYIYGKIKNKSNKKSDFSCCNKIKQLINFLIVYNYNTEVEAIIINKSYYQVIDSIDSTKMKGFSKAKRSRIYKLFNFWEQNDLIEYDGNTIIIRIPKQFVETTENVFQNKIDTKKSVCNKPIKEKTSNVIKSDVATCNNEIGRIVSAEEYMQPVKEFEKYVIENYGSKKLEEIKLRRKKDYADTTRNLLDVKSLAEVFEIYNK